VHTADSPGHVCNNQEAGKLGEVAAWEGRTQARAACARAAHTRTAEQAAAAAAAAAARQAAADAQRAELLAVQADFLSKQASGRAHARAVHSHCCRGKPSSAVQPLQPRPARAMRDWCRQELCRLGSACTTGLVGLVATSRQLRPICDVEKNQASDASSISSEYCQSAHDS